jgi:hemerythrin
MTIRNLVVTHGVHYVEIPEADTTILCGAPADSIKHLLRRGIIQERAHGGLIAENGPNAILLSDAMIQNGQLSNLAEFPILQMLYRQGMIVPGHPNNTGRKPRLIGTPEQLAAQLRYIHRGNYGLISVDEMMQAGIGAHEAEALMRIKLYFAFGRIAPPEDIIECIPLTARPTDIGDGVFVKRLAHNVFRIAYGKDAIEVDLNLAGNSIYPCPYPLTHVEVGRHYFAVVHSGDGDGWDFDRPAMGSVIIHQGRAYLVDAGPNVHHALDALGIGKSEIAGIFHTHCHDDHFAGLTTLLQCDHPIPYYAAPLVRAAVARKFCALLSIPESEFASYFDIQDLEVGAWNDIMGLEVRPTYSPHPVETAIFNFRVLWEGGYRTYAHLADIAAFRVLDAMSNDSPDQPGTSPALARAVKNAYLEPADLKKIDIGGGMIHGEAADFADDASKRLMLAHIARPLTVEERRIGSGAPFGTLDVMIPGQQNFLLRDASEYLKNYFPTAPLERLHMLLNNRIVTFNPETIIVPAGRIPEETYLILAGKIEMLPAGTGNTHFLSAGSLIAESAVLHRRTSEETYRTASFVQALRLPADLYRSFIERFFSSTDLLEVRKTEDRLRRSYLFSDAVTNSLLHKLAKACRIARLEKEDLFCGQDGQLHIIVEGSFRHRGVQNASLLTRDMFWGFDSIFGTLASNGQRMETALPPPFTIVAESPGEIISLPLELVSRIPVVRWKLFEAFRSTHPHAGPRYRKTRRQTGE